MNEEHNIEQEILFVKYAAGLADDNEKAQVEELTSRSQKVSEELDIVHKAIGIRKKIQEMESYDIPAGYKGVHKIISKVNRRKRFINLFSRVAAIFLLPLLASTLILGYLFSHGSMKETAYVEVVSAPGLVTRFELPDQSKVWLNSGSTLRYPIRFGKEVREVELKGEAYFEVQSDKEHPFYVKATSGLKIMAYGTQFNINAQDAITETILAKGKVAVFYNDDQLRKLSPGEKILFDNETKQFNVAKVSLTEKLAWKDGKIIFRNAPLNEVFERLSKRYNVEIILHDEHSQADRYLSRVTFSDETIQQIFSYLEIAAPIKWKITTPVKNNDSTLTKQRIEVWLMEK